MRTIDIIKRLRGAGLSQSEIARRTGIPQPRISRWENGEAPGSADDALTLAALARELDANPSKQLEVDAGTASVAAG